MLKAEHITVHLRLTLFISPFFLGQLCLLPFLWECCGTELLIIVVKARLEATGVYPPFIIPMNVLPSYRCVLCC